MAHSRPSAGPSKTQLLARKRNNGTSEEKNKRKIRNGSVTGGQFFVTVSIKLSKNPLFSVKTHLFFLQSDCHVQRSGAEVF
jgi:hypothetical protein